MVSLFLPWEKLLKTAFLFPYLLRLPVTILHTHSHKHLSNEFQTMFARDNIYVLFISVFLKVPNIGPYTY